MLVEILPLLGEDIVHLWVLIVFEVLLSVSPPSPADDLLGVVISNTPVQLLFNKEPFLLEIWGFLGLEGGVQALVSGEVALELTDCWALHLIQ